MKLKLECTLRFQSGEHSIDIVQDVNLVTLPDNMSDEDVVAFYDSLRSSMKTKYIQTVLDLIEVDINVVED